MAVPPISVVVDHAQPRVKKNRIASICTGKTFGKQFFSNVFIDPVTNTLMRRPMCKSDAFFTSATGIYSRLSKSDYTLTSASWDEFIGGRNSGDKYLNLVGNNELVITSGTYGRNRGFYVSIYQYNTSNDEWGTQVEFGWRPSTGETTNDPLSFRVRASGRIEVFRYGVYLGDFSVTGKDGGRGKWEPESSTTNQYLDLLIIPFRRREVLVLSNQGDGFVFTCEDIPDSTEDGEITPADCHFYWYVPEGQATVQCAAMAYEEEGYICGEKTVFTDTPDTLQGVLNVISPGEIADQSEGHAVIYGVNWGDNDSVSLVQSGDGETPWSPADGLECLIRLDLSGDFDSTPFISGVMVQDVPVFEDTDGSDELDLTNYCSQLELDVPDDPANMSFTATLMSPIEIDDTVSGRRITEISNRPMKITLGDVTLMDGITESPQLVENGVNDRASKVRITVRGLWHRLENYIFSDVLPLDGMDVGEAIRAVCKLAGLPEESFSSEFIENTGLILGDFGTDDEGNFGVQIEVGDTAAEWILRLHDEFAGTWFLGEVPINGIPRIRFCPPETIEAEDIEARLHATNEDAENAPVEFSEANQGAIYGVYRNFKQDELKPEANDIWVTGLDPRTLLPIVVHRRDEDGIDASVPTGERTDNWRGEITSYAFQSPDINSKELAIECCNILYDRLTKRRFLCEVESEFLIKLNGDPFWRGNKLDIGDKGTWKTLSLNGQFEKEPNGTDVWRWRPFRYVNEKMADVVVPEDEE